MLANVRFCFLLGFLLLLVVWSAPGGAQVQGVPPGQFQGVPTIPFQGVPPASFGFQGNAGSYIFSCCANFTFPSSFTPLVSVQPPFAPEQHHRHHRRDDPSGVIAEPVYIPYAIGYAADSDDDTADDQDASYPVSGGSGAATGGSDAKRLVKGSSEAVARNDDDRDSSAGSGQAAEESWVDDADNDSAAVAEAPEKPQEPVIAQPTTVLVFKDGHRADVVNYAIVGDTLFDFAGDRTHKILLADLDLAATRRINDEQGVEFKLPASK